MKKAQKLNVKHEDDVIRYIPHEGIVKNMKLILHHKKKRTLGAAGEVSRMKNHYLKYVFQNMADLIFFFEATSEYPELAEAFESDIQDLLGIKRLNPRVPDNNNLTNHHGFIFKNLVAGMIRTNSTEEDFRLKLLYTLHDLIWFKITPMKILETIDSSSFVLKEFDRSRVWLDMLSQRVRDVYDWSILTNGIKGNKLTYDDGPRKNRIWRNRETKRICFKKDAESKGKKPKRTIQVDARKLLEVV